MPIKEEAVAWFNGRPKCIRNDSKGIPCLEVTLAGEPPAAVGDFLSIARTATGKPLVAGKAYGDGKEFLHLIGWPTISYLVEQGVDLPNLPDVPKQKKGWFR